MLEIRQFLTKPYLVYAYLFISSVELLWIDGADGSSSSDCEPCPLLKSCGCATLFWRSPFIIRLFPQPLGWGFRCTSDVILGWGLEFLSIIPTPCHSATCELHARLFMIVFFPLASFHHISLLVVYACKSGHQSTPSCSFVYYVTTYQLYQQHIRSRKNERLWALPLVGLTVRLCSRKKLYKNHC